MYIEKTESGDDASPGTPFAAYFTPGKQLFCVLDDQPVACVESSKAAFYTPDTVQYFAVSGSTLYAITATFDPVTQIWTGTATTIGAVDKQVMDGTGGQLFPAQIIVIKPTQIFVVAAGGAWVAAYGQAISASILNPAAGGGGTGYAVGDTGTVDGGLIPAEYVVTSVDAMTGAVTGYTLTYAGTGYALTAFGAASTTQPGGTQPGSGDGFGINITGLAAIAWLVQKQLIPDAISGPFNFVRSATWMDGYVIVSMAPNAPDPQRRQFFISGLNVPTSWSALDFDTKESNSDPVVAVYAAYEILIPFGSQTSELWQDSGNVLSAFQRLPGGGVIENGLASTWAISKMDGTVCWLGSDSRGWMTAWQLRGTVPVRISNHAIENSWRSYNPTGASSYSYQENGHFFWVVHFPIPDKTWVYDSTIGPGLGWHERASADEAGNLHADIGRYHAFATEVGHCVGDYSNGNLYLQSLTFLLENCATIPRIRVSPHVCNELKWTFFDKYRLHCLLGFVPASGPGSAPVCNLEISNDGGITYGSPLTRQLASVGDYKKVIEWLRAGRARNRVVRWTMNEPIDMVLVDLYAEASAGSG